MLKSFLAPEYLVERNVSECIGCNICINECSYKVHIYDKKRGTVTVDNLKCVNCQRCVYMCPKNALTIVQNPCRFKENANWTNRIIKDIYKQAETGGILRGGMGNDRPYTVYWDHILLNASQVTNPSIDPLREPMELKTFLGGRPDRLYLNDDDSSKISYLELEMPIMFSAMSFGSVSINVCKSLAKTAAKLGIMYNAGEGGLHEKLRKYAMNTIVQVASGRFGVNADYLHAGAAIEIKVGQGAKPGIGGHLPGNKVGVDIAATRMIPIGSDAISPAPHHDIYSIEDLKQLIISLKEAVDYSKPVFVKIAAVHNVAAICSGIVRAGADVIAIDGFRGGTGAAPITIRDNVGIPVEFAIASVDSRLREEGIRNKVSLVCGGGIRSSSDIVKAIALGADAVYIGTAALIAIGCHMCQKCYTGKCNWGIATQIPELVNRLDPDASAERLENLLRAWVNEIKEILGGMGINAIESLRGNRLMLRGIGLTDRELNILGIKAAGE